MPYQGTARFILRLMDSFKSNEDKVAVVDQNGQRQTTYGELYTLACRVAAFLREQDYPAHSFIGICLPTSVEYVASEIGIWLAGHAIVPMGDKYPRDRIDYITHHCNSPLLINDDVVQAMMKTEPAEDDILPNEGDINALFYTSGSTGNPKGVIHTFRSLNFSVDFDLELMRSISPLTFGYTSPPYFIACRFYLSVLLLGGTIDFVSATVTNDIRLMENYIESHQLTALFLTSSMLRYFHGQVSCLQLILTGSERLAGIGPRGCRLVNIYGQTETFGPLFSFEVDRMYDNTPIGKPYPTVEMKIVDEHGNIVKPGESGELCLTGDFTLGYYKEEELTSRLFRDGLLHTGDLVGELPDGNLIYLNRQDWMVKINGQRVEPSEVEAVLRSFDGVDDAVVKGFTIKDRQFLCAYYIAIDNVSEDTIRDYLRSKLPTYMVPAYFVRMDRFPLLPNGKTDRKSLLTPTAQAEGHIRLPYAVPTNHVERQLCEAFEKALSVDHVGIDDDFLELGGDSIRVMQVQALCPGLPLSARMIYANRTPAKIAEACKHSEVVSLERQEDYPLSHTQLGIFVECLSRQGEVAYNNGMLFQLNPTIDADQLSKACETVVEAHPYIKTRLFIDSQGNPRQVRNDAEPYRQNVESLTQQEFDKLKPKLIRPFDLLNDRLFRIRILKTPEAQYLFIDFHHIIFDGMSFNIFLQDLKDAYRQLPVKREDFTGYEVALEEESLRQTDAYTSAQKWYKEQFEDIKVSSLPIPERQDSQITFGQEHLELSVDYHQLQEVCDHLDVTPNVLTTTVFGYMLGVSTHAQESLFATIFSGRQDLKTQRTVAMLVKTLPVYTQWQSQTTVRELLQATKRQLLGSMSNSLFSFAEVKAMNSSINSHILFAYQGDLKSTDDRLFVQEPLMENATGEHLAFEMLCQDAKLVLQVEYQSNRYSRAFVQSLMSCYSQLLAGFANSRHADSLLSTLPLLTDGEREAVLALGTGEQIAYDTSETIVDIVRRHAVLQPENVAVVDDVSQLTYAELDRRSDLLASALRESGVATDLFVAIMLSRRKEFLVAVLAVFKAGGAYIPLDSDYPRERLSYMLDDSGALLLITDSTLSRDHHTEAFFPLHKQLLVDTFDFTGQPECPVNFARPSGLAYMIYTSGTTGKPKGVMIEHQSLRAYLEWHASLLQLTPADKCALHSSFSFDASLDDLLVPLAAGSQVHILSAELRQDMKGMYDYFLTHAITSLTMSTQLGLEMLNSFRLPLRYLMLGGSKMTHVDRGTTRVINGYGPTEFTVCSSYYVLEADESHYSIPIGRPVPNSLSVIVDLDGRLVPRGVVGELCLLGTQMSRGYWRQEELTRQAFVDCPFLNGQKMYRTGDLARWTEDGLLEYVGRIDNQVKLHGYRIELEEIEDKICRCPGVLSAAAVVRKQDGIEYISAYYVSEGNRELSGLGEALAAELPAYMLPSQIVRIDEMPLTPNGKIDRQALPAAERHASEAVMPATAMEQQVYDIVSELLHSSHFGVTDNLVFYGLSSLPAMRLCVLLEKRLHASIRMADIMSQPTVRAIAARLATAVPANGLHPFERQDYYPLMENQRGLYLEWEKDRLTTQYNMPAVYRFHDVDADRLVEALRQTIDAHSYMKARLVMKDGDVVFERHDDQAVAIVRTVADAVPTVIDFQQRVQPFMLLNHPLFRLEVISTPADVYLFFDVHHIIFDGLSNSLFMNDLKRAYDGQALEAEAYQAYDYALYEQAELQDAAKMAEAEAWYDEVLADANVISVPNFSFSDGIDFAKVEVDMPGHAIEAFCAANGVTVNSYMHAAFAIVVRRLIKEDRPLYLTVSNGRDHGAALQQCVGMFVKTLPVVITPELAHDQPTVDFVRSVHQQLQKSYSMDYYPYTQIVSRHRINAQLMFLFQGGVGDNGSWEGVEQIPLSLDTVKFPMSIVILPKSDGYRVCVEYDGKRYHRRGILLLLKAFANVCLGMVSTPTLYQVELVSPEEKVELLRLSRGETIDYDQRETFVDLFERQVALTPDSTAAVDADGSLTYRELDSQSDVVAQTLVARGVAADDFVGVMLSRSKEFLVAVLGVFKAGGAYIPLDHEYPETRLLYMLDDAQAKFLLSTRALVGAKGLANVSLSTQLLFLDDMDLNAPSVPVNNSRPASLAYMIYTSGSTGRPKGVMMEHKGLCALMKWLVPLEQLKAGERCAEHASFSFDASLFDLFPPLTCGASVHILSSDLRHDMEGMRRYFTEQHIVGMTMSTQLGMEMVNSQELPLRYMVMGGEKMNKLRKTAVTLINGYGPTEFTVCSSYHVVNQSKRYTRIPIGRPVPNSISVIVDNMGHLVPRGIPGELCLIGRQMSRGYWRQAEQTASHFTPCPFLAGETMYHTGDVAMWNKDGELEYLGRTDNQVKFNGYRIELSEIESRMTAFQPVTFAAAVVIKEKNTKTLAAYYCADREMPPHTVLHYLSSNLPKYMMPQVVAQIDKMPMTPNGKIDKEALTSPAFTSIFKHDEHVVPAGEEEQKLYDIAKLVLGRDDFGVTDNLTYWGLTSLMAIKLADLASKQGMQLKVNDILKYGSVRKMAALKHGIITWDNGYHPEKPVVVLLQGFTSYQQLAPIIGALSDRYSVCLVDPLEEHVKQLFQHEAYTQVIYLYTELLDVILPPGARVSAFIGHSFGGELAYQCCVRWHTMTGQWPHVFLFDSYCHADRLTFLPYDGDIVLFKATEYDQTMYSMAKDEVLPEYEVMLVENERHWRELTPQIDIVPVEAGHFSMLEQKHVAAYMDTIKQSLEHPKSLHADENK